MGAMTYAGEAGNSRAGWLMLTALFIIHEALASWGVIVAAPWVLFNLADAGHLLGLHVPTAGIQWLLYGTPYFPAYILIAFALGWLLGGWLAQRVMLWVWVLPLLVLCVGIARYPHIPTPSHTTVIAVLGTYPWQQFAPAPIGNMGIAAALSHFFGWGHGFQPYDQVLVVVPFYTSAAYSLGALLAGPSTRKNPFFEGLRRVRIWRVALVAGLPYFLIRGVHLWEQGGSRMPFFRTTAGLQAFVAILLIGSASVTLVFAVTIALVGPRFAVTRFFIRERIG